MVAMLAWSPYTVRVQTHERTLVESVLMSGESVSGLFV